MAVVPLDKVAPGNVLAAPARDRKGRLLLAAGHELSLRTLESLKFWGITALDVLGEAPEEPDVPEVSPEILALAEAETNLRFANAGPPHPFLDTLRDLAIARRARAIAARQVEVA